MTRSFLLMMLTAGGAAFGEDRIYPYVHLDVFTDRVLTGNQLAVFLSPEGLSGDEMQLIAREMAFSETTFVFPAETAGADFRVRIFTPSREIDFAGHPTIGTAFALARAGKIPAGAKLSSSILRSRAGDSTSPRSAPGSGATGPKPSVSARRGSSPS
jgi:predicted PhzF superfamily epimerase YddE/YHI9